MRLLLITNQFPNATQPMRGTFNLEMALALKRLGHTIEVVSPVSWVDEWRARRKGRRFPASRQAIYEGVPVCYPRYYYTPKLLRTRYGWFMWQSIRGTLLPLVATHPPDIVMSYWAHPDGHVGHQLARQIGKPCVVVTGGSDVLVLCKQNARRRSVLRVLNAVDMVVAVSADLKHKVEQLGVDPAKVHIGLRGVDTERFCPGDRAAARQRLALPADRPILLWVGEMLPVKGLETLIAACAILRNRNVDFLLQLVGKGPLRPSLESACFAQGLQEHVRFVGPVRHDALPDWYRAADLMVLPSRSEGTPNVLLESIACGTPFVASGVGGIPEIAAEGVDRVVPPGDTAALADAIEQQLATPGPFPRRGFTPCTWTAAGEQLVSLMTPLVTQDRNAPSGNRCTERTRGSRPRWRPAAGGALKNLKLLLSFDHELHLGGCTSYAADLFDPTDKLLDLASAVRVPITLFTDVCAALRFRQWDPEGYFAPYRRQLQRAVAEGHDVQLHVHPHWLDSTFDKGRFVPASTYALGSFIDRSWPDNIAGIIERGMALLDELCCERDPAYKCIAFRAGGYCLAPRTAAILSALYQHGIRIESSVAKGNYLKSAGWLVDHSGMPGQANWFISPEGPLDRAAEDGLYEIPIAARPRTPWNNLPFLFRRLRQRARRYRSGGWPYDEGRIGLAAKIGRLLPRSAWMLGFDNFTFSVADLMAILRHHIAAHPREETIVCSAISHPKLMGGYARDLMAGFVERVRAEYGNTARFCTYREVYDDVLRKASGTVVDASASAGDARWNQPGE
jgi:glycosyltransferase involved in cell wall biosynthesis